MKHVIFYSWQSDLDPALTRNFIEEALDRAVRDLNRDETVSVEAVMDRDTAGVAGTPGISETIFQKINQCDVFVCDVSIVNASTDSISEASFFQRILRAIAEVVLERTFKYRRVKRPTPNPNVILELGYAAARIGWNRVILVQNTAYGDMGTLPFDLRGRRIVPFNLSTKESRPDERPKLREQLQTALRRALEGMLVPYVWVGMETPRWFGFWHTPRRPARSNTLFVREVGATGFFFHLSLVDGSRTGSVAGYAAYTGPDSSHAFIKGEEPNKPCELKFRRAFDGKERQIHIEETRGCNWHKGLGASFEGTYICSADLLFDYGALTELDLQRLYTVTGNHYQPLLDSFQQIGKDDSADTFVAEVYTGGVKGLYRFFGGIVMKGELGQLWAAYTEGDKIRYFTTEPEFKQKLPTTIERWAEGLSGKEVAYMTEIQRIPSS